MPEKNFILASTSPQRRLLLEQIGFMPKEILSPDIDETPHKNEKPTAYVKRMAEQKALHIADKRPNEVVLAADTILVEGGKIIQKSHSEDEQTAVMKRLSGKAHKVITAVCVVGKDRKIQLRLSVTKVISKRFSESDIAEYVAGKEWCGCAGYKIEGQMAGFIKKIVGSYSGVVGLPLFEAKNMLQGAGVK